jgi:hypothetical protein
MLQGLERGIPRLLPRDRLASREDRSTACSGNALRHARACAARWRGGTVAVKVLSHEGSRARKLNALHESMVCAAVHHPNVVRARMCPHMQPREPSVAYLLNLCAGLGWNPLSDGSALWKWSQCWHRVPALSEE